MLLNKSVRNDTVGLFCGRLSTATAPSTVAVCGAGVVTGAVASAGTAGVTVVAITVVTIVVTTVVTIVLASTIAT